MGSLFGIGRAMDLLIYNALNAAAIILWRIDIAFISWGVMGYGTQDWLTGDAGKGAWYLFTRLIGAGGLVNVGLWEIFLTLAVMLAGVSRILRPFVQIRVVDLGRLLFFACASYILITQGISMMQSAEQWRGQAGGYIYSAMSESPGLQFTMPGDTGGNQEDDPIIPPGDLDGQTPIRGWEAVSTSYFLVSSANELHIPYPPAEFRETYCLYDPTQRMEDQGDVNASECNPAKVYDNWDVVSTGVITNIFGIPIPDVNYGFPIIADHPENREEGIRRAQSGVARLALGAVVSLFPLIEANIALMLTMAAVFIYISLPIVSLFGFFLQTETMVVRMMMQFISIFIRTLILQGIVGLFLLILVGVAASGSLTSYLGLIGVGLVGGFFLMRMAAHIMTETLTQSLGAIGSIATGVAVGAFGEGARRPTQALVGAAQIGAAGAATIASLQATGIWNASDIVEAAGTASQQGLRSLTGRPDPDQLARLQRRMPPALEKLRASPAGQTAAGFGFIPDGAVGVVSGRPIVDAGTPVSTVWEQNGSSPRGLMGIASTFNPKDWTGNLYDAGERSAGEKALVERARPHLGDDLVRVAPDVLKRHERGQVEAVLSATEAAKQEDQTRFFDRRGALTPEGVNAVRTRLDPAAAAAFDGLQGRSDLAALVALGAQEIHRAQPEKFRQKMAAALPGTGEHAPAQTVPAALNLDNAAAGSNAAGLNRFARLSEAAGLSAAQRQRLLTEARGGDISTALKEDLAHTLGLKGGGDPQAMMRELMTSAQALPETLAGPRRVRFSQALREDIRAGGEASSTSAGQPPSGQVQADKPTAAAVRSGQSGSRRPAPGQTATVTAPPLAGDEAKLPPPPAGRVFRVPVSDQGTLAAAQPKASRDETRDDQPDRDDQSSSGRKRDA